MTQEELSKLVEQYKEWLNRYKTLTWWKLNKDITKTLVEREK